MSIVASVDPTQLLSFDEIIDVRSPAEFEHDHIPGAISAPVLDNEERIRIGTLHKQLSAFDAKKAGAALVAANIAGHLTLLFASRPKSWRPLIYCWRGGQRSGSMAEVFSRIGWKTAQLAGGYKNYRRHVLDSLATLPESLDLRIVCGVTGSGKSRLLRALDAAGAQVLDLEQLARHRGSVLGSMPGEAQPSQKMFESQVLHTLNGFTPDRPIYVEAESKKIGLLQVPEKLMMRMRQARCFTVDMPVPLRIAFLKREYAHYLADSPALNAQLDCLLALHGRERIAQWKSLSAEGRWDELVEKLLAEHYDPAYLRGMARNYAGYGIATSIRIDGIDAAAFDDAAAQALTLA